MPCRRLGPDMKGSEREVSLRSVSFPPSLVTQNRRAENVQVPGRNNQVFGGRLNCGGAGAHRLSIQW